jgi:hypothetical protein
MPSAMALNVETNEFFPQNLLLSYSSGYQMADYSPKAQRHLHKKYPAIYPSVPSFLTPEVIEVPNPPGVSDEDFKFYKNVR